MDKGFLNKLVEELNKKHGDFIQILEDELNLAISVEAKNLIKLMEELKDNYGYDLLENVTAVDYSEKFVAVYSPVSTTDNPMLLVKVDLPKDSNGTAQIPSLVGVYKAANVQEREVYDLMGITYSNHPNLARILLADDFEGHPLRKDYQMKKRV